MADTRCADPEYQLDVDIMILEYLLHQAIKAQFLAFDNSNRSDDHDEMIEDGGDDTQQQEAGRLTITFNAFMPIFKTNHPDHEFEPGTSFNITILETLVMLNMLRYHNESPFHDLEAVQNDAIHELRLVLQARRRWSALRYNHQVTNGRASDNNSRDLRRHDHVETDMYSCWNDRELHQLHSSNSTSSALTFSILHRFMMLSAKLAPVVGGGISDKFKDLACQAMLQTALASLDTTEPDSDDNFPTLGHCFAYGFVNGIPEPRTNLTPAEWHLLDAERMISELFQATDNHSDTENPEWTEARHATLMQFRMTLSSTQTPLAARFYEVRLAKLRHKFPWNDFEQQLLQCLEVYWMTNCREDLSGKPVLVQIEEGGLEGLNSKEFEEFLRTVGLR